jgi:outer membrane protein
MFILLSVWGCVATAVSTACAGDAAPNREVYNLDEIYKLSLERSEAVGISAEDLNLANTTREKAFSVLVPAVSAYANHTRYLLNDSSLSIITGPDATTTWGASLSQSFTLNGRELTALKVTEDSIEKSEYDLSTVKENFLLGVAAAYYDVLRGDEAVDIAKANVERLTTYRDSVSVKLGLEEVAKTDMYRAEAELSSAKASLIAAENQLKYARVVLAQLSGVTGEYEIADAAPQTDPTETRDVAAVKENAYRERTELKSAEKQQVMADRQISYYKGAYWPSLTLEGSYSNTEAEPGDAFVMSSEDLSVSLTLSIPLYDGGLKRANVGEAVSVKRQADLAYSAQKKQVALEVEQAYLSVVSARSVLDALSDQVTFSEYNYDAVVKQFQYGLANSVDVMDANTSLVTAERQLSDASYSYQLAILKLARTQGVFLSGLEERGLL